jgi:hypothetical protein
MKAPKLRLMRWWRKGSEKVRPSTGSLTRRIIGIAGLWIVVLLGVGGYALDKVLTNAITNNFDESLDFVLTSLIASSEIGPEGEVLLNRPPADQRFRALFRPLFPDHRRRLRPDQRAARLRLSVALPLGPAA